MSGFEWFPEPTDEHRAAAEQIGSQLIRNSAEFREARTQEIAQAISDAVVVERYRLAEEAHDTVSWQQADDWHAGYQAGLDARWNYLFRRLYWLPETAYYWLLDRLTSNNGWRPLSYREAQK